MNISLINKNNKNNAMLHLSIIFINKNLQTLLDAKTYFNVPAISTNINKYLDIQ